VTFRGGDRASLLAGCGPDGCTEALMLAHGFTTKQMVELVRAGLATASTERVVASGPKLEIARVRITRGGSACARARWAMTPVFTIHGRGTVRLTICIGPWALKVARNARGRRCNRFEADLWASTTARRRNMLCPVLARLPFGLAVIMQRAEPLREDEHDQLTEADGFPDWDYVPSDEGEPFEYAAERAACCIGLFGTGT
jgi:hypothetical protein